MLLITAGQRVWTGLITITLASQTQRAVARFIWSETELIIRDLPGFVGAALFESLDGTQVVLYVQWETVEAFHAAHRDPLFAEHIPLVQAAGTVRWESINVTDVRGTADLPAVALHPRRTPQAILGRGAPPAEADWAMCFTREETAEPGYLAGAAGDFGEGVPLRMAYLSELPFAAGRQHT
jgi:hypothetical protein